MYLHRYSFSFTKRVTLATKCYALSEKNSALIDIYEDRIVYVYYIDSTCYTMGSFDFNKNKFWEYWNNGT